MTKRRSVWMSRGDFNGVFSGGHGAGMAFVASGHVSDVEFREVLPDDGWQPWSVAKQWERSNYVLVWIAGNDSPVLSTLGCVSCWGKPDEHLYMRVFSPDED